MGEGFRHLCAEELLRRPHRRLPGDEPMADAALRLWSSSFTAVPSQMRMAADILRTVLSDAENARSVAERLFRARAKVPVQSDLFELFTEPGLAFRLYTQCGDVLVFGCFAAFERRIVMARLEGRV